MDKQITISENRLKIVLEVYKKGVLTFEEATALLTVDDRPISQINPDWLRQYQYGIDQEMAEQVKKYTRTQPMLHHSIMQELENHTNPLSNDLTSELKYATTTKYSTGTAITV